MIKCTCPNCGIELDILDRYAGLEGKCTKCQHVFVVPSKDNDAQCLGENKIQTKDPLSKKTTSV